MPALVVDSRARMGCWKAPGRKLCLCLGCKQLWLRKASAAQCLGCGLAHWKAVPGLHRGVAGCAWAFTSCAWHVRAQADVQPSIRRRGKVGLGGHLRLETPLPCADVFQERQGRRNVGGPKAHPCRTVPVIPLTIVISPYLRRAQIGPKARHVPWLFEAKDPEPLVRGGAVRFAQVVPEQGALLVFPGASGLLGKGVGRMNTEMRVRHILRFWCLFVKNPRSMGVTLYILYSLRLSPPTLSSPFSPSSSLPCLPCVFCRPLSLPLLPILPIPPSLSLPNRPLSYVCMHVYMYVCM